MTNITKTSMKDQVYNVIKEKILLQEFNFGDTINIAALGNELGVSNTPIREALSKLEVEGLVTSGLNKKVKVIELSEDLMKKIHQTFFALVFGSYSICKIQGQSEALIAMMEKAISEQEKVLKEEDFVTYVTKSINFDRCIVEATENEKLLAYYDSMTPLLFLLTNYNHQHSAPNRAVNLQQHKEILAAVKEQNTEKVQTLIYNHYDKHMDN